MVTVVIITVTLVQVIFSFNVFLGQPPSKICPKKMAKISKNNTHLLTFP